MKTKLLIVLIAISAIASAQDIPYAYDSKEVKALLADTLYIVPTGDHSFDSCLIASVKKYWTITPSRAISPTEETTYLKDEKKHFIAPVTGLSKDDATRAIVSPAQSPKPPTPMGIPLGKLPADYDRYTEIMLYVFHGSSSNKKNKMDFAISITECHFLFNNRDYVLPFVGYMVKNLNDNIKILEDNKMNPYKNHISDTKNPAFFEALCANAPMLKHKTLLILEGNKYMIDDMKKYKYKYQVVSIVDMIKLLNTSNDSSYCFMPETGSVYDPVTKAQIFCMDPKDNSSTAKTLNNAIEADGRKKKK